MKRIYTLIFIILTYLSSFSQKKGTKKYQIRTIAFYNLENLFDTINNPIKNDEASPIMEYRGRKAYVYNDKIKKLGSVISEIGYEKANSHPALVGVAEVENDSVLNDLVNSDVLKNCNYKYIHHDSPDERGIDVALLYDPKYFKPTQDRAYELLLFDENNNRVFTRDQLLVSGYLDNELIHIIVNHWPSKRGGSRSVPYRLKAAELNLKIINEIKMYEPNAKIITLGDFNDDPNEKSFKKVLKTKSNIEKLAKNDLYNPYENLFKSGYNTLGYNDNLNLFDQIIISEPLVAKNKNYETYNFYQANIYNNKKLITSKGKYKGYPLRSFANGRYTGGYSDHLPVYINLIRVLK